MGKIFYVDTSVWRDYFEDRGNGIRPLGELAFLFLRRCLKRKDKIIVSNAVVNELLDYFSREQVKEVFSAFKEIIVKPDSSITQEYEAHSFWIKTKKKFPFPDILHSIIARDNRAVLVSRDKHFGEIGIAECLLPEEAGY